MRKRFLLAALLLMQLGLMGADELAPMESAAKPWEPLWRFDTHG